MNRLGKKTPVWRNTHDGRILCGGTVQDALGVSWNHNVGPGWERATSLPAQDRVVIAHGRQLINTSLAKKIAAIATVPGAVTIEYFGRDLTLVVTYVDGAKVIIETQQREGMPNV
jgi:hypothetical protein